MWVSPQGDKVACCVFDLAGTLFWSPRFEAATHANAIRCVADTLRVAPAEAHVQLESRRRDLSADAGFTVALSAAVCSFGVNVDVWQDYQKEVDLADVLSRDAAVAALLGRLQKQYLLVLYTNMCRVLAVRVLDHLGLGGIWAHVITPQETRVPKPAPDLARKLLLEFRTPAAQVLSIGDRAAIDLLPFTAAGAGGYLVTDRTDLLQLLSVLNDRGESDAADERSAYYLRRDTTTH